MRPTDGETFEDGVDVVVTAAPVRPRPTVTPYELGLLAQTLATDPTVDAATGVLRFSLRIPGDLRPSTALQVARSLARIGLSTIGLDGWDVTVATRPPPGEPGGGTATDR